MEKILTISVATYNLENLIEDNLRSFEKLKNLDDIEVLVIDDGSKDNTANIVQKYCNKYPNSIKLIKQKNSGPGSTVNTGIKNATGIFFKMVDGDDWINSEGLDKLINLLKDNLDIDAFITNDLVFSENDKKIIKKYKFPYEKNKILNELNCEKPLIGMHSISFKTSILKENNVKIDNGFYTDVEYLIYPLPYVKKVMYFDIDIYIYRIGRNEQSVSYTSLIKNKSMHELVLNNIINFYEKNKTQLSKDKLDFISIRICNMILSQLNIILLSESKLKMRQEIIKFISILKKQSLDIYTKCKKIKRIKILIATNYFASIPYAILLNRKVKK